MSINRGSGNLLAQDVDALVNTVNTEGVMGKGIALQFKRAWPAMFTDYAAACRRGEVAPGHMHVWATGSLTGPRYIINFPTKRHWRSLSRMGDIESGLVDLRRVVRELGITSIAVPPLGCGNGGLAWHEVEPAIHRALEPLGDSVEVRLFAPSAAPRASEQLNREPTPRLTESRAALLALMREYERVSFEPPTLVEVQELAYFLQTNGEPLRLTFAASHYGPYADELRKSLRAMEGHFIVGFGDGSAPVIEAEPIRVVPAVFEQLDTFIAQHPETRSRIDDVLGDIEGYESTYGLELLASVHWVMNSSTAARDSSTDAHDQVHKWSARKASLFTLRHVEGAWRVLRQREMITT